MADVATTKNARTKKTTDASKSNGAHAKTNGGAATEAKAPETTAVAGKGPAAKVTRNLFGTDGIRGTANEWPITPELALGLGKAVAHVAARNVPKAHVPRVLIGKDTRLSGYMIEQAIAAG
ncbi:MAG TPA: hypothetical protein VM925_04185, partial [Labilithrix sp.]|nr:hypothetical protein [Labilithrix sp.]